MHPGLSPLGCKFVAWTVMSQPHWFSFSIPGFWKIRCFKKAQHTVFWGFIGFGALFGFGFFYLSKHLESLMVDLAHQLSFQFNSPVLLDFKICRVISYWSPEAVNVKKSLIITGVTNRNWIKYGAGFLLFFSTGFTQNPVSECCSIQHNTLESTAMSHNFSRSYLTISIHVFRCLPRLCGPQTSACTIRLAHLPMHIQHSLILLWKPQGFLSCHGEITYCVIYHWQFTDSQKSD